MTLRMSEKGAWREALGQLSQRRGVQPPGGGGPSDPLTKAARGQEPEGSSRGEQREAQQGLRTHTGTAGGDSAAEARKSVLGGELRQFRVQNAQLHRASANL